MNFYAMEDVKTSKNDGERSVWKMTDEERLAYIGERKEQFLMSMRTIGTVLTDDEDLDTFVTAMEDLEPLSSKEYEGLVKNIKRGKVVAIGGFDITKYTTMEQLKLAKGAHYLKWAMKNIDDANDAMAQSKRDFEAIFKGRTTLEDYF